MSDFERFREHGRLRMISKKVDPYSLVFENNNKLYIALSSGQTVSAEHLHERSDNAVYGWLTTIFLIGMEMKKHGIPQNRSREYSFHT